jgi:hypothetical protein
MIQFPKGIRRIASKMGTELPAGHDFGPFGADIHLGGGVNLTGGFQMPAPVIQAAAKVGTSATAALKQPYVPTPQAVATMPFFRKSITAPVQPVKAAISPAVTPKLVAFAPTALLVSDKPLAAMAAADQLLGNPAVGNASDVIQNTIALAQAGHPEAIMGAMTLQAVDQLRQDAGVGAGQAVIPIDSSAQQAIVDSTAAQSAYQITPADLAALAAPSVVVVEKKKSLWAKILSFFGLQRAAS